MLNCCSCLTCFCKLFIYYNYFLPLKIKLFLKRGLMFSRRWGFKPCNCVVGYQRFGGPCWLHLQGDVTEDGGSMDLRNVGVLQHYTASQAELPRFKLFFLLTSLYTITMALRFWIPLGAWKYEGVSKKFPDWVDNEINNSKYSLTSNTKGYGGKTR
jgi:hypothetical protein